MAGGQGFDDLLGAVVVLAVEAHFHNSADGAVILNGGILETQTVVLAGAQNAVELGHDHLGVVIGSDLGDLVFGAAEDLVQLVLHSLHGGGLCQSDGCLILYLGSLTGNALQFCLQGLKEEHVVADADQQHCQEDQQNAVTGRNTITHFLRPPSA